MKFISLDANRTPGRFNCQLNKLVRQALISGRRCHSASGMYWEKILKTKQAIYSAILAMTTVASSSPTHALDLNKAKFPLYYECHSEKSAGLMRDKETGELKATVFLTNRADKWQMKIEKIENEKDLSKFPANCTFERRAYAATGNWRPIDFAAASPQFCAVNTYIDGSRSIEAATYCRISSLKKGNGEFVCGITDSFYFDSDRLEGIRAETDLTALSIGFNTTASINKIRCTRLDR